MIPSPEEAAKALRDIDFVTQRAAGFQDYRAESSQLILWGLAYLTAFSLIACFPAWLIEIWSAVVLVALGVGVCLAQRSAPGTGIMPRYLALVFIFLLFIAILHLLFWPVSAEQGAMLGPLLLSLIYILRGVQLRPRYTVIGVALGGLCLTGYLLLLPVFWSWMAIACGGTLILSGFWLRSH